MLRSGGTNRSLKMEGASWSTTGPRLGLAGTSRSIPDSSLDPLRDDRSLKRLDFLSEPLGEAKVREKQYLLNCWVIYDFSCYHDSTHSFVFIYKTYDKPDKFFLLMVQVVYNYREAVVGNGNLGSQAPSKNAH